MDATTAQRCLEAGADFVLIGRGAMLHHDFASRALADPAFRSIERPVSRAHLQAEGLGPAFLHYVASTWPRFVADALSSSLIGTLGYLSACLLFGLNLPLSAELLRHFDPFWVSSLRYVLAALLLGTMVAL